MSPPQTILFPVYFEMPPYSLSVRCKPHLNCLDIDSRLNPIDFRSNLFLLQSHLNHLNHVLSIITFCLNILFHERACQTMEKYIFLKNYSLLILAIGNGKKCQQDFTCFQCCLSLLEASCYLETVMKYENNYNLLQISGPQTGVWVPLLGSGGNLRF